MAYTFDGNKLTPKEKIAEGTRPAVIVTCGSYNPITIAHADMFTGAKRVFDTFAAERKLTFAGAYLSPVNDAYKKPGLAPYEHRAQICELALKTHPWLNLDRYEGLQEEYQPAYYELKHIQGQCETYYGQSVEVFFLCGGDLFETFYKPGVWILALLRKIFADFNLIVVARAGAESPADIIKNRTEPLTSPEKEPGVSLDLTQFAGKVSVVEMMEGDVSSTMVRNRLKAGEPLDGLVEPDAVKYLQENKLYLEQ